MSGRKPVSQRAKAEDTTHEIGLREARGIEVLARRFVAQWTVSIGEIEAARGVGKHAAHLRIVRDTRPIPYQAERGCGLFVLADPDGIAEFPGPILQPRGGLALQRLQDAGPLRGLRIIPGAQLRAQLEKPREPVGPLEGGAILAAQISQFA